MTAIDLAIFLGRKQLGLFLWNLLVRKNDLRLIIECLFSCIYCWVLKLCMSMHVCFLCSWTNSPRKSKAKFFSLLPETGDRLIRKSDDSNKMGWGVHSWDFAAYEMIALYRMTTQGPRVRSSPQSFWWREVTLPVTHHIRSKCSNNSFGDYLFNPENVAVCF